MITTFTALTISSTAAKEVAKAVKAVRKNCRVYFACDIRAALKPGSEGLAFMQAAYSLDRAVDTRPAATVKASPELDCRIADAIADASTLEAAQAALAKIEAAAITAYKAHKEAELKAQAEAALEVYEEVREDLEAQQADSGELDQDYPELLARYAERTGRAAVASYVRGVDTQCLSVVLASSYAERAAQRELETELSWEDINSAHAGSWYDLRDFIEAHGARARWIAACWPSYYA